MKKKAIGIAIAVMLLASVALVSCGGGTQLTAPVISLNGTKVTWTAVENASGYEVTVNGGTPVPVQATEYTLTETAVGSYKIVVKALGDGKNYLDSEPSNEVTVTVTEQQQALAAPVIAADGTEITWSAIEHATGYEVYVDGELKATQEELVFTLSVEQVGDYQITVKAISSDAKYTASAASNSVKVTIQPAKLLAPVVSAEENVFTWQAINHAAKYQVYVDGTAFGEPVTETTFTLNVTEFKTYSVTVKAIPTDANYVESDESQAVTYTKEKQPVQVPVLNVTVQQGKIAKKVEWNATVGASAYEVYVNSELAETIQFAAEKDKYEYTVSGEAGEHSVYVKAITADSDTSLDAISQTITVVLEVPTDLTKPVYAYNKELEERLSRYILGIADESNKNSLQLSYQETLNNHVDNYLCNMAAPADTTNSIYRKHAWQLEVVSGYDTTKSWVNADYPVYRIKLTSGLYLSVAKNNLIGMGGDYVSAAEYVENDIWQYWQLIPASADNELNDTFCIYNLGHCYDWNNPDQCLCDTSRNDGGAEFWSKNDGSPFIIKNVEGAIFPEEKYVDHSGQYLVSNFANNNLYAISNGDSLLTNTERQLTAATAADVWTLEKADGVEYGYYIAINGKYLRMENGYKLGATANDKSTAHVFALQEVAGVKNGFKLVGLPENGAPTDYCAFNDGNDGQTRYYCYSAEGGDYPTNPGRQWNSIDWRNSTGNYWIFTAYQATAGVEQ